MEKGNHIERILSTNRRTVTLHKRVLVNIIIKISNIDQAVPYLYSWPQTNSNSYVVASKSGRKHMKMVNETNTEVLIFLQFCALARDLTANRSSQATKVCL